VTLGFVILYKFGDALAGTMSNPLYVSLGFTKVEAANIAKAYGFLAGLAGLALGRYCHTLERTHKRSQRKSPLGSLLHPKTTAQNRRRQEEPAHHEGNTRRT
jgi:hypothetical protein